MDFNKEKTILQDPLGQDSDFTSTVLSVLAVIGGVDNRIRLGGHVQHETHGTGTVARITHKGKIHVQFASNKLHVCRLSELVPVSLLQETPFTLYILMFGSVFFISAYLVILLRHFI